MIAVVQFRKSRNRIFSTIVSTQKTRGVNPEGGSGSRSPDFQFQSQITQSLLHCIEFIGLLATRENRDYSIAKGFYDARLVCAHHFTTRSTTTTTNVYYYGILTGIVHRRILGAAQARVPQIIMKRL